MANEVRSYASDQVLVIYGGVPLVGLAPDTFVSFAPVAPRFTSVVGADGDIARSRSSNKMWTGTITLQAVSPSNDVMSGFATVDDLVGGGVYPLMVQDLSGRTLLAFSQTWISGWPTIEFGSDAGTREWAIEATAPTVVSIGGNA
jgi:hypothetical protein